MNTSYVFLADGFEEVEALTVVDVMRRAGMEVSTVSIADKLNEEYPGPPIWPHATR